MSKKILFIAILFALIISIEQLAQSNHGKRAPVKMDGDEKSNSGFLIGIQTPVWGPSALNWVAVDTMGNCYGPAIGALNPLAFDPWTNTVLLIHRGATTYGSIGRLFYNYSTDAGATWTRVTPAMNGSNSAFNGRYPSMTFNNPTKSSNIQESLIAGSWPELVNGAFGGAGAGADLYAGAGFQVSTIYTDPSILFVSQVPTFANDGTAGVMWASDNQTNASLKLWKTVDFQTVDTLIPPTWTSATWEDGGNIAMGGAAHNGTIVYGVLGTFPTQTPIVSGWLPGFSKSTDNGATWSTWKVADFRNIPALARYDRLYDYVKLDEFVSYVGDIHIDKDGYAHMLFAVTDTTVDNNSGENALVEVYETATGWEGKVVYHGIGDSSYTKLDGPGLGQVGPAAYLSFDKDKNVIVATWNMPRSLTDSLVDIYASWRPAAGGEWSAPVNLTDSPGMNENANHAAPYIQSNGNNSYTAYVFMNYPAGYTGYFPNGAGLDTQPGVCYVGGWTFTTQAAAPSAPTLVTPTNGAANQSTTPTLTWNAVSGATSYRFQVSTNSGFTALVLDESNVTTTSRTLATPLSNNTTYYWRVSATNQVGTSLYSSVWNFTTSQIPAPAIPTLVTPTNGATNQSTTPTLTWDSVPGATSYRLQVSANSSFTPLVHDEANITSKSRTLPTALANNTQYFWKVNATNAGGTSGYSHAWSFTTKGQSSVDSSLVGYWTFDGGNGVDSSFYHNDASQIFGGVSFVTGKKGLAAKFGGTSNPGHIKIPNSSSLQFSDKLSIAFWMNFTSYSGTYNSHALIAKDHDVRGFRVQGSGADNHFHAGFHNGPYYQSNFEIYNDYPQYTPGDWIHVVVVIEGNSGKLYFNGILDTAVIGNQVDFRQANNLDLYFGKYSDSWYPYNGMLDEVRIYNRVLSSQEISNLADITPQIPSVTLISPNGGEKLSIGQIDSIKWTSANIERVKLEYSTDGGFNWLLITSNTPAVGGSYSWLVPNTPSLNCKVRISDINSSQNDTSDFGFQIVLDSTLIAYYPFNENTNDLSGNGKNGTAQNNYNFVPGVDSSAVNVISDGSYIGSNGGHVLLPSFNFNNLAEFSLSLWVKEQSLSNAQGEAYIWFGEHSSQNISISHFSSTVQFTAGTAMVSVPFLPEFLNNWKMFTLTYKQGVLTAYLDGVKVDTAHGSVNLTHNFAAFARHWWGGGSSFSTRFTGALDDARIYSRQLSDTEVLHLYQDVNIVPAQISLLSPLNGAIDQSVTPTFTWNTVPGATFYWLQVSTDSVFTSLVYDDSTITAASKTLPTALSNNTKYYWRVSAKNTGGTSGWSLHFNFRTISPMITLITPNGGENMAVGKIYQIKWTSQFVQGVKLELSTNEGNSWSDLTSIGSGAQNYNWPIPTGTASTSCKLRISDQTDPSINDISNSTFVIFEYPSVIQVSRQVSFTGTSENSYRMLGFPGNVSIPVSPLMSGTQKIDWQAYRDNGVISNSRTDYLVEHTSSNPLSFTIGRGLWILSKNAITVSRQENSVTLNDSSYALVPLQSNWNMITNPYNRVIQWSKILTVNNITNNPLLYSFNGSWNPNTSAMTPYEGYYFYNAHGLTSLKVPYDPNGALAKSNYAPLPLKISDNKISLSLVQGSEVKSNLVAAIDATASEDFDSTDYFAPPSSFEDVSIIIKNQNLKTAYKSLFAESRPMNGDGQIFDLQLKNVSGEELRFDFTGMDKFKDYDVYLFDSRLKKYYNLKEKNSILSPAYVREGKFSLLIGKSSFIESEKAKNIVNEYSLFQNYPNPFNPKTEIMYSLKAPSNVVLTIYDITGSIVANLVDGYFSEGYHEAVFNADNLASGIYIYRLEVKNGNNMVYTSTKKMVVTK